MGRPGTVSLAVSALWLALAARAAAAPGCVALTRESLVPCVLGASLAVRSQSELLAATAARQKSARLWLPSPPALSFLAAGRSLPGEESQTFANWYLTLGQEIEIGGERGARVRSAEAATEAQARRVRVTQRDILSQAWALWFEALAASEQLQLSRRTEALLERVAAAARGAAERGLLPPVDADTAEAQALKATQARAAAERRWYAARAMLGALLGAAPEAPLRIEGALEPLAVAARLAEAPLAAGAQPLAAGAQPLAAGTQPAAGTRPLAVEAQPAAGTRPLAVEAQPEVEALVADERAAREQASLFRRMRAPRLTLSITAQNDGANERVIGGGLSLPIPLPEPLGRQHAGEIAEAEALGRRAAVDAEQERRRLRAQLAVALESYRSLREEVARYTPERLARATRSLESIADQIAAGRLAVRDALFAEQSLLELLSAAVEARRALCLASVQLARAAGVALEGNPQ